MTQFPDIFNGLTRPFDTREVKTRPAQGNRQLHYITARTAMNRLDEVVGPENWWDEFHPMENSVVCRLSIRLPDGQIVTKADAGGYAGMADSGDDDKSGFSDAFKRACAKFGVARYLYNDGVPEFARSPEPSPESVRPEPPVAPVREYPPPGPDGCDTDEPPNVLAEEDPAPSPSAQVERFDFPPDPRTGSAFFAWASTVEKDHMPGRLMKHLNGWGKLHEFPGRMTSWKAEQVTAGIAEVKRYVTEYGSPTPEKPEDKAPEEPKGERVPNPPRNPKVSPADIAKAKDARMKLWGMVKEYSARDVPGEDRFAKEVDQESKKKEFGRIVAKLDELLPPEWRLKVEAMSTTNDLFRVNKYIACLDEQLMLMR